MRTKWWHMPLARVPSGRRREEAPPCWSADEGKRGVNRKELSRPGRGGRHGVRRNAPTREQRKRRPGRGRGRGEDSRLTLVADGVVPEGAGALVLHALEVALPGGGGVLELLVAVVAVVLPQGHRVGCWAVGSSGLTENFHTIFLQKLRISFANPKPSQNKEIYYFVIITDGFQKISIRLTNHRHRLINYRHR